tara:strand:- start:951 stop:1661 length:711 start_codon:yes stop_codon:yes gene_type:complete
MQVSIVTGSSGGIGKEVVHRLQSRGDYVIALDIDPPDRDIVNGESHCIELTNEQDVSKFFSDLRGRDIKVSNVINAAGIIGERMPLWDVDLALFSKVLNNNVISTFLMCKYSSQHMIEKDYGRIVNFGAIAGKDGSALSSHYAASKAAIIAVTKALGKELASYRNILCNCVVPAAVRTEALLAHSPEDLKSHMSKIPKGRFCEPEEVAELVAWLASSACSFSTGAAYDISGGRATY